MTCGIGQTNAVSTDDDAGDFQQGKKQSVVETSSIIMIVQHWLVISMCLFTVVRSDNCACYFLSMQWHNFSRK